jgi:outer membrane protein OmpA-like peptidoglycan-associated protein
MTRQEPDADARIALLKRLVHACPQVGQAFAELGDLYFKQNRWGETIAAYKSAVELTGDEGVRDRLEKAVQQDAKFVKNARLQPADVKGLFSGEYDVVISTMGPGGIVIKARVVDSIQRQVRFDEWSARIKGHFLPDLKVIGQGLKEQLPKHADVRLLIEGHTDKRGPVDRNMKLSKDRAEAIKNYLVQNYGIDPARLATEGYGPTRPYSPEETDKGYALNRRVEFKKIQ